jgi:GH15 family glucan-1,4-alpha-glucosidase
VSKRIEDYALIGDRRSGALVARDGAIDWLCWPHFDSDACFAALLGDQDHGSWRIAPREMPHRSWRRYRGDTLILETRHETATGSVCGERSDADRHGPSGRDPPGFW